MDRLRSPEQLDQAITVTNQGTWLALAATGLMTLLFLGWSIFGESFVRVQGEGVVVAQNLAEQSQHDRGAFSLPRAAAVSDSTSEA